MTCPCCRAENASGPTCRRCKADLTLLFALRKQRQDDARKLAVEAVIEGDFATALRAYQRARPN